MIRTDIFPGSVHTPQHSSDGTRRIRFFDSAGTVNVGPKDLKPPRPLSMFLSSHQSSTLTTSSTTGHGDWEPRMASIPKDAFQKQKHKKESLESLREILRHARSLRLLENWHEGANSTESTSNTVHSPNAQGSKRVSILILVFVVSVLIYQLFIRKSIRLKVR